MSSKILYRQIIELNEQQNKMVKSGWGYKAFENSIVEKITYLSDDLKIKGYLAYPKETNTSDRKEINKYPCIIWNRGGSFDEGSIDSFTARGIFGQLASWGYVVFASQYRGNAGSEGTEQLGGDDVNDILNLMPLADYIPQANKEIWGIEGWSRGGMMTYLTLLKNANFKCAILVGAISNLKQFIEERSEQNQFFKQLIGNKNFEDEIEKRTIINLAEKLPKLPYLLMHGGDDKTVSPSQTIDMAKKMDELNIPYRLVIYEGGGHFLKSHRKEVDQLRRYWFDKYLK
jgi:dipeptidyl aminopeptidase/acylaminoacyl peptidase